MPPVTPMLAKPVSEIPPGQLYEPKWDGFRSIIFRDGDEVEIGSRNERPMTRYFPEVVDAVLANFPPRAVIDGEIIVADTERNTLDFEALQQRIHPAASRVKLLAEQTPASFVAFDLLALGDDDLTERPLDRAPASCSRRLADADAAGARHAGDPRPGRRPAVVRAVRGRRPGRADRQEARPALPARQAGDEQGQARADGRLRGRRLPGAQVRTGRDRLAAARACTTTAACSPRSGVVGAFPMATRKELFTELQPLVTTFDGHPWDWAAQERASAPRARTRRSRWNAGKDLSFVPLRPERVVEVRYDYMEGDRFRHTTQFVRWRPDREPRSCTYEQLERPVQFNLADVLGGH